jgi:hypothetical protein
MAVGGVLLTSFWYIRTGNMTALIVFAVIMIVAAVPLNAYLGKLRRKPNDTALEDESSTTNRNKPLLAGHWNVRFRATVGPLFIVLTLVNALLMWRYGLFLLDFFSAEGDGEQIRFLLLCFPLPVAFSFAWYKLTSWLAERDRIARQYFD